MAVSERPAVLVGFAEALAGPESAWSLLDAGHRVVAFTRRGRRAALRRCREVELVPVTAPEQDLELAAAEVRALAARADIGAFMPLDDAALRICADGLGGAAPVAGPTGELADIALDKRRQLELAAEAGFAVPPTSEIRTEAEALALDCFPLVLKPALAATRVGGRLIRGNGTVCADREELERAVARWRGRQPFLAQSHLLGVGEGLFGLAGPDGVRAWSAHRRLRMMNPQGSGSSACVSIPVDERLRRKAERLLRAARWSGLFMVELLRDAAGEAWFVELNGRPWGSMALARGLGLEYPAWAVRQRLEPGFEPVVPPGNGELRARHLGRELVHVLMVMRGPRSRALTDWPSRLRTLRDVASVRRGDRWYNRRQGSPGLFLADAVGTVRDQVFGRPG
jgi:hypothetical protein